MREEYAYWLPTIPGENNKISDVFGSTRILQEDTDGESVKELISRCSVCMSPYKLLALHSFKYTPPDQEYVDDLKAKGWKKLYEGYSFIHQIGARTGFGSQLARHGSCLVHFNPANIVQAREEEFRWTSMNFKSYWVMDFDKLAFYEEDYGVSELEVDDPEARREVRETAVGKCMVFRKYDNSDFVFDDVKYRADYGDDA